MFIPNNHIYIFGCTTESEGDKWVIPSVSHIVKEESGIFKVSVGDPIQIKVPQRIQHRLSSIGNVKPRELGYTKPPASLLFLNSLPTDSLSLLLLENIDNTEVLKSIVCQHHIYCTSSKEIKGSIQVEPIVSQTQSHPLDPHTQSHKKLTEVHYTFCQDDCFNNIYHVKTVVSRYCVEAI